MAQEAAVYKVLLNLRRFLSTPVADQETQDHRQGHLDHQKDHMHQMIHRYKMKMMDHLQAQDLMVHLLQETTQS